MNWFYGVLINMALVLTLIPLNSANGEEPTPDEIPKLIQQLASADVDLVERSLVALRSVRTRDGVSRILNSLSVADEKVRLKLFKVMGEIGEPAVEPTFDASVPRHGTEIPRNRWASHVLTCYLRVNLLPLLKKKIRKRSESSRAGRSHSPGTRMTESKTGTGVVGRNQDVELPEHRKHGDRFVAFYRCQNSQARPQLRQSAYFLGPAYWLA